MTREATDLPATTRLDRAPSRLNTFIHALLIVTGFSLVFIVGWDGAATLVGGLFVNYKTILGQLGGVLVILFGLHTLGLLRLCWLDATRGRRGLGLPWLAPVFMKLGWTSVGKAVYLAYAFQYHQLPQSSFFLFGDQFMYLLDQV